MCTQACRMEVLWRWRTKSPLSVQTVCPACLSPFLQHFSYWNISSSTWPLTHTHTQTVRTKARTNTLTFHCLSGCPTFLLAQWLCKAETSVFTLSHTWNNINAILKWCIYLSELYKRCHIGAITLLHLCSLSAVTTAQRGSCEAEEARRECASE